MSTCNTESSGQFLNLNMLCFWYDCIQKTSRYLKSLSPSKESMKNQWLRHYTCSGFCKTTYHLLISQPPKYVKVHTGDNKIDRQSRMRRQYTCYFPANCSTNPDVFQPKTFPIPKFHLAGVHRFGGVREHPNRHTDKLTH